ncbi:DMT family transporter [uncultured Ruegeria sp.]|uniref:DMT family transporter n=1 Tax=uncultured Ruegeria sp. TaxID=259304 RepID=UPI00260528B5|nr:DMT family transporter [uncultured Ruegeria sp.]
MSPNVQGACWALLAAALFAIVAALAKLAAVEYHVLQILFFRQIVVLASTVPAIFRSFPGSLATAYPGLHGVRLAGAFAALSMGIWAVAVLPLTTAVTLGFVQVFFVTVIANWFLGETVGFHRIIAVVAGFCGVLITMQPGTNGLIEWHSLIPIAGAFGAAVAVTSVRKLSQTESTATLLVFQSTFVGLLAGIPMFWLWKTPDLQGLFLLFGMGGVATLGQWVGVRALRLGETSFIAPIEYVKLVYAALFGYLLFREIPDTPTLVGASIIVASSLYIIRRETLKKPLVSGANSPQAKSIAGISIKQSGIVGKDQCYPRS